MQAVAKNLRARASEHSSNFCEQFEQRSNFESSFRLDGTIRYSFMKPSAIIPFAFICQRGRPRDELGWYTSGSSVQLLPLPVPDAKRPWGSEDCKNCNGFCTGHFICLEKVLATDSSDLPVAHICVLKCPYYPPICYQEKLWESSKGEPRLELRRCRRTCKAKPSENWRRWNVGNTSWFCKEATTSWCS